MVNALVQLDGNTNKILNIVKARYGLKNKGEAIQYVVNGFVEYANEADLKPEYIKKLGSIEQQKGIRFKSVQEFRRSIEDA